MRLHPFYRDVVDHFADQPIVTLATGATCAFFGDERSVREHLVCDETARHLRRAGHTVIQFFIDDNLDPLNFRQLRVAMNKNEAMIEKYKDWCGKPIAYLPDPWGCCESYAAHFEEEILNRLHYVGCHPTLIRVSKLYERGLYRPAVRVVLENPRRIATFLKEKFPEYVPEKLFWPLCSTCGYIDSTRVEGVNSGEVQVYCSRCEKTGVEPLGSIAGKLNWKLDCAARWTFFDIRAEVFAGPFLEPHVGSYHVAQALSCEFFGGHGVLPISYGLVSMDKSMGGKLLDTLPPKILRNVFVETPAGDINLTRDSLVTAASRHEVAPGFTYIDFIKQVLPVWLLTPQSLSHQQRELVKHGIAFGEHWMQAPVQPHLPQRQHIEDAAPEVLSDLEALLRKSIPAREAHEAAYQAAKQAANGSGAAPVHSVPGDSPVDLSLQTQIESTIAAIGGNKKAVLRRFRTLVGQEHGLPVSKLILLLPLDYLRLLRFLLELWLNQPALALASAQANQTNWNGVRAPERRDRPERRNRPERRAPDRSSATERRANADRRDQARDQARDQTPERAGWANNWQ